MRCFQVNPTQHLPYLMRLRDVTRPLSHSAYLNKLFYNKLTDKNPPLEIRPYYFLGLFTEVRSNISFNYRLLVNVNLAMNFVPCK